MKHLIALVMILAVAGTAAGAPLLYSTAFEATATNATKAFGFTATTVIVKNNGANEAFVRFNGAATTTTTSIYIAPNTGRRFFFTQSEGVVSVGVICSGGETANVTIEAYGAASPVDVMSVGPDTMNADDMTVVDDLIVGDAVTITGAASIGGTTTAAAITASGNVTVSNATASRLATFDGSKVLTSNPAIATNAVPKSSSSGATLVASTITDDGTTVTINTATTATTTAFSTTGTLSATGKVTTAAVYVVTPTAQTVPDSGNGSPATATVAATVGWVNVTCSDADGCALTLSEAGATSGSTLRIVNVGSNTVTLADSAGVQETTGALSLGPADNVTFCYVPSYWAQCSPVLDL